MSVIDQYPEDLLWWTGSCFKTQKQTTELGAVFKVFIQHRWSRLGRKLTVAMVIGQEDGTWAQIIVLNYVPLSNWWNHLAVGMLKGRLFSMRWLLKRCRCVWVSPAAQPLHRPSETHQAQKPPHTKSRICPNMTSFLNVVICPCAVFKS